MRIDDTSSKGSAQGEESVADEQGAQAPLSRATRLLPSLVLAEPFMFKPQRLLASFGSGTCSS